MSKLMIEDSREREVGEERNKKREREREEGDSAS